MAVLRFRVTERHILLFILGAALVGYGGAVLFINFRKRAGDVEVVRKQIVHWMPPQPTSQANDIRYIVAELLDPSLMSLPNIRGFSRSMWLRQLPAMHRTIEPPTELAFLDAAPSPELNPLVVRPPLVEVMQTATLKLPAQFEETDEPGTNEPPPVSDESRLQIVDGLSQRLIIAAPDLPKISADAVLRPTTRVRVGVASDGTVRFAMLERPCGNEAIDAQALDAARHIRFQPQLQADDEALSWGVIRFLWAIATPSATNGASGGERSGNQ